MPFVLPVGLDFADGLETLPVQPVGASGTPTIIGTAMPTAQFQTWTSAGLGQPFIEEQPGSPKVERAEQCTCEHRVKMDVATAIDYWSQMGMGTVVQDSDANIWRILSCDYEHESPLYAILHYVMESISFDTPPDEFSINDVSLDLHIIKHPRYAWALNPNQTDSSTSVTVGDTVIFYTQQKEAIIRMIQNYIDSPFYPNQAQVQGLIQSSILSMISFEDGATQGFIQIDWSNNPGNGGTYDGSLATVAPVPWNGVEADRPTSNCAYFTIAVPVNLSDPSDPIAIACAAAKELISKLWRQEDTPVIPSWEIVWTQKFFAPIYLNPGSYIEDPRDWVPEYFLNPNYAGNTVPRGDQDNLGPVGGVIGQGNADTIQAGGVDGASIFDYLTTINPQLYSTTGLVGGPLAMSCLRKSDHYNYERTWFSVAHTWWCSCIGKFDKDLYSGGDRPQTANDFSPLPP